MIEIQVVITFQFTFIAQMAGVKFNTKSYTLV
jgi:hypothetical protein